ncbi:MAG: nucleotidyl transferase AbiEii/AbiGii toxin family protein [Acidimicrobiia bacterium]
MTSIESALRDALSLLDEVGRPYALVGGLAVSVHAEPRLTRDVDVVVAVADDDAAEEVVHAFGARGYAAVAATVHEPTGRLSTIRLTRDESSALIDLLFASSGIEYEITERADRLAVTRDLVAPVASVGHLIALKLLARDDRHRPNDADDLRQLAALATVYDWDEAREAVDLISDRGFDRGRDLAGRLAALRADS